MKGQGSNWTAAPFISTTHWQCELHDQLSWPTYWPFLFIPYVAYKNSRIRRVMLYLKSIKFRGHHLGLGLLQILMRDPIYLVTKQRSIQTNNRASVFWASNAELIIWIFIQHFFSSLQRASWFLWFHHFMDRHWSPTLNYRNHCPYLEYLENKISLSSNEFLFK